MQVLNDTTVGKLCQNFHFWVNYHFSSEKTETDIEKRKRKILSEVSEDQLLTRNCVHVFKLIHLSDVGQLQRSQTSHYAA